MSFFDDLANSVTGAANREEAEKLLEAQTKHNENLLKLEQEKLEYENSPAYLKQQTLKIVAVSLVSIAVLFIVGKIFKVF